MNLKCIKHPGKIIVVCYSLFFVITVHAVHTKEKSLRYAITVHTTLDKRAQRYAEIIQDQVGSAFIPEQSHCTLRFLGCVPKNIRPQLAFIIDREIKKWPPIALTVAGWALFGMRHNVVVLTFHENETLNACVMSLNRALEREYIKQGRTIIHELFAFVPHMAVGRINQWWLNKGDRRTQLMAALQDIRLTRKEQRVQEVALTTSEHCSSPYTPIHTVSLKAHV